MIHGMVLFPEQDTVLKTGELLVEEALLEGHLGVTKELLQFQSPEKKFHMGCEKGGANLIKVGSIQRVQYLRQRQVLIISSSTHLLFRSKCRYCPPVIPVG